MDLPDIMGTWDYASLPANVQVGAACFLERRASFARFRSTRDPGLVLGNRVRVYTWAEFNVEPEGLIDVDDDSILVGPVFMCAQHISIGKRVLVSYHVTLADSDFHPHSAEDRRLDAIANAPGGDRSTRPRVESMPVVIEDDVWIGIGAMILKGVRIGQGARVMAGAVVTHDIPPGATVAGNPGRLVEGSPR